MGRGDRRTKKGKIFRKSHGKSRPKGKAVQKQKAAATAKKATAKKK